MILLKQDQLHDKGNIESLISVQNIRSGGAFAANINIIYIQMRRLLNRQVRFLSPHEASTLIYTMPDGSLYYVFLLSRSDPIVVF